MKEKWTQVKTNKLETTNTNPVKAANIVKNIERKSLIDLKKQGDAAYEAATARKENLLQAFKDKKLKSKALIKEAKALKKAEDKKNKAAKEKAAKETKAE